MSDYKHKKKKKNRGTLYHNAKYIVERLHLKTRYALSGNGYISNLNNLKIWYNTLQ